MRAVTKEELIENSHDLANSIRREIRSKYLERKLEELEREILEGLEVPDDGPVKLIDDISKGGRCVGCVIEPCEEGWEVRANDHLVGVI